MTPTKKNRVDLQAEISPAKRKLFTLVMLASPLVLLVVLEAGLHTFNYGGNLDLVTRRSIAGREFYSINRSVARRYFTQLGSVIPEPADDTFALKKAKNTKRIFCLGESTMAGFPYEFHATAPSFLRDRLKVLLPGYDVEVINVGLSAINTFVVQDFMDELLSYEPDLFIIYAGHNEFYGIYGVGSSISVPGGPWLTRLHLHLLKFKTYLLLRDGTLWIQRHFSGSGQGPGQSLMGQMVGKQTIPLHGSEYQAARQIYNDNLTRLIRTAKDNHVRVLFSALVSNWRGQKPFVSVFDTKTSPEQQEQWRTVMAGGDSSIALGRTGEAVRNYRSGSQIDSMNATAFFKFGTTLYSMGLYDEAKAALLRAKDLDALRFRATMEFEQDLIRTCRESGAPIARVDSVFVNASPHGILDDNLFLEHLHPNISGYFLMAKTLCRAIEHENLLVPASGWNHQFEPDDSSLMEISRVTEFDRAVGKVKIELLKRRWPFETGAVNYEFKSSNPVESVVFRMMKGGIAWSDARYLLAEFYARNKQYDLARKECLAVAKVIPFHYEPLLRYADYYTAEGKRDSAMAAYKQCFETDDNPFARIKYAMQLLEDENAGGAVHQLDSAFMLDASGKYKMTVQGAALGRYLLGVGYAKLGKFDQARESAERALIVDPANEDAKDLLRQLRGRR